MKNTRTITIDELIEMIDRAKELRNSGVQADAHKLGAPSELADILNTELLVKTYEEE